MKKPHIESQTNPPSSSISVYPSTKNNNFDDYYHQVKVATKDQDKNFIANDIINSFFITRSEMLLSFLNSVEELKSGNIQHFYLNGKRNRSSFDANINRKGSDRRLLNNRKERNTNSRKKQCVLPDTTEKHTEVEVVSVPLDVYYSPKAP